MKEKKDTTPLFTGNITHDTSVSQFEIATEVAKAIHNAVKRKRKVKNYSATINYNENMRQPPVRG